MKHIFTPHQEKQVEIISNIEKQIKSGQIGFSTVGISPNYETDTRIALTSAHFPNQRFLKQVNYDLIKPLKDVWPEPYYYPDTSFHLTIKNIRVINDPPHFNDKDVTIVTKVFDQVTPTHHKFKIYFYRLLLFVNNLALVGTTDSELDNLILALEKKLTEEGVADDKQYVNDKYFFSNLTLARFNNPPTQEFRNKVEELSQKIDFKPYIVDSVSLLKCNAVLAKKEIIKSWQLQ